MKNINYIIEKKSKRSLKSKLLYAAILVAVFYFGFAFGGGHIQWRSITSLNKSLPNRLNYSTVDKTYEALKNNYDGKLDEQALLDGLNKGLVDAAGDPYTEYFTAKQAKEFQQEMDGTFSGIGAELGKDKDAIVIVAPIKGFPAEKAGLKPKDIIIEIDGTSAYGLSLSDAVSKIRGPLGTKVKLKIIRDQKDQTFEITREEITIPSVDYEIKDNSIGYIRITRFSDDTADITKKAAIEFKQKSVKGVVLDLRGNPGGLLDASVDVASIWLPKDALVLQEKRAGITVKEFRANGDATLLNIPLYVLIDGGSASASEIVAGALKDNKVATLLGEKSYGKGSVQSIEELPGGAAIKVTVARWYTPNGQNIDKQGIKPDVEVKMVENSDVQLQRALEALRK